MVRLLAKHLHYQHYLANDIKTQEGLYSSLWCINTPTFFPFLCSFCGNMLLLISWIWELKKETNYGRSHIEIYDKHPLNNRCTTVILPLSHNHLYINVPILLTSYGRGDFFPQPWRVPTTAVGRSCHGRDELKIPVL